VPLNPFGLLIFRELTKPFQLLSQALPCRPAKPSGKQVLVKVPLGTLYEVTQHRTTAG
jgi:hypothetical protein